MSEQRRRERSDMWKEDGSSEGPYLRRGPARPVHQLLFPLRSPRTSERPAGLRHPVR